MTTADALIVGGGPAGLSAALNLGRARARVVVADADRPRNAATMRSHGYLTRDGIPPHELRRIARDELTAYPEVEVHARTSVTALARTETDDGPRFVAALKRRGRTEQVRARAVLVATGLRETLPEIPSIRGFYGMSVFSCVACDGWELRDRPLALIGETPDLADRARLIARWTDRLTVFTNGTAAVGTVAEAELASLGVVVDRRVIDDLEGERGVLSAVRLADGERIPAEGGFVRPRYEASLGFLDGLGVELDPDGHLATDRSGRTNIPGLYAAGDVASPGPQQLIVAAGAGARVAAVVVHDLTGVTTTH